MSFFEFIYFASVCEMGIVILSSKSHNHSSVNISFYCVYSVQIPWWALVTFGSYSLWSMGWGLWSFRDCPDALEELMGVSRRIHCVVSDITNHDRSRQEIAEAKQDLRAKGVSVD